MGFHLLSFINDLILQSGVPETLRQQSEAIMHSEVDQSLKDLSDNINTEKTLKTISLHVQKAADNVQDLPKLGDKVTTIIIGKPSFTSLRRILLCDFHKYFF